MTPHSTSRRILIVEDQDDISSSLARVFELLGHETAIAPTGADAIELGQSYAPDIAIVDIGLPDMPGYEVVRTLRQGARGTDMLIVTLSGWSQAQVRGQALEAGADRHLVKPATLETLRGVLSLCHSVA